MPTPPSFAVLNYDATAAFTALVGAAGNITQGKLVGLDASGEAVVANAATGATLVQALGIAGHTANVGERLLILPACTIYDSATSIVQGNLLYAGAAGAYVNPGLNTAGDLYQLVGYACPQDKLLKINIQPSPIKVQASAASTVTFS